MTFYLKYRPKNLSELDLKDVGETLTKIVKSESIPHAFLFSGPKGTGKTSAARILAKILNCEQLKDKSVPCDKCDQCLAITKGNSLDVIEMDAASNRGIDDVRSLKDAIKLSPTSAKRKVYIVDEAHMLTTEASNALLKTLEEPPPHVVFILATTNPEKLIDTIKSRCMSVNFRKASNDEIVNSLKRVVKGENLNIADETLDNIANNSNGAFRDATKMLEQVSVEGEDSVNKLLIGEDVFVKNLIDKKRSDCLLFVKDFAGKGLSIEHLIKNLMKIVEKNIIEGDVKYIGLAELLINALEQMKNSPIEELPLEIVIVKWCSEDKNLESEALNLKEDMPKNEQDDEIPDSVTRIQASSKDVEGVSVPEQKFDNEIMWKRILDSIKPINASLEALLRSSKPINYDSKTLTLGVYYKFHKERLEEVSHRKVVEEIVTRVLNSDTKINCILMEAPVIAPLTEDKDKDIIRVAEEIFS